MMNVLDVWVFLLETERMRSWQLGILIHHLSCFDSDLLFVGQRASFNPLLSTDSDSSNIIAKTGYVFEDSRLFSKTD